MEKEVVISVKGLNKTFKLPHENAGSIKNVLVGFMDRKRGYEIQEVLKNVSFEINKGDFFGIVGRNGSGKSTLLKLLAGIYTPTSGSINVKGMLTPFIELGVGFNPELTGRENVFLNGSLLGFNRKEMLLMYDEIVEFSEIERFMDQKLKNYSSGMQVRLAFSIAIQARSDILLLDEVLAVGDAAFQQKCFNYFEKLKKQKSTVVFVTHDMGAVRRFCTKAIYIKNGKIICNGTPADVADVYVKENIEKASKTEKTSEVISNLHEVELNTIQKENKIILNIVYKTDDKEGASVGISVVKDGISIAEVTTAHNKPLTGKGKVSYELTTDIFNEGSYYINAALFNLENRGLLAVTKTNKSFIIKGTDITRGAALKLEDTWEYSQ